MIWKIIGLAVVIAIILYYWYNPAIFKVHPEKKYPENYTKHADPHQYKEYR